MIDRTAEALPGLPESSGSAAGYTRADALV